MGRIILVHVEPSCLELLSKLWRSSHAPPPPPGCDAMPSPLMSISKGPGMAGGGAPRAGLFLPPLGD